MIRLKSIVEIFAVGKIKAIFNDMAKIVAIQADFQGLIQKSIKFLSELKIFLTPQTLLYTL